MPMHRISSSFTFSFSFLPGFALALALGACTSSDSYVIVTVDSRPAVHDAKSVSVTLSNSGSMRTDSLVLRDQVFPVTFSISTPGRSGDLAIAVEADDENGLVVGRGSATTTVESAAAKVMLDPTDFVVNTDYAGNQFPSDNFEAGGFQVAALADGTWTTVFRDACTSSSCTIFARRFDKTGRPVQTQAAAGTNAFAVTARPTSSQSTPAVAASQAATIAVWNFSDVGTATTRGIACRTLDTAGRLGADQTAIDSTTTGYVVSVAALASGNFATTWRIINASAIDEIHLAIIQPDCTTLGGVQLVAKGAIVADFLHRGEVAGSADRVLVTWVTNGDVHLRMASSAGVFSTADTLLVSQTPTDEIASARVVAASGGGFVVGARWAQKATTTGTGRIQLYRVDPAGALISTPTLVTDKTGSERDSSKSFAMASRSDGTVLIAWHACGTLGDASQCGVFGRILRDTGEPITDAFAIPTNTLGDQLLPSVAALPDGFVVVWSDASAKPPDPAGLAVRGRIIYPYPYPPGK